MIDVKKTNGPTLVGGAFDIVFGEMEKVENAIVYLECPGLDNTTFDTKTSVSGQTVTVTIMKCTTTAVSPTAWAVATTGNVAGQDVVVIATGI